MKTQVFDIEEIRRKLHGTVDKVLSTQLSLTEKGACVHSITAAPLEDEKTMFCLCLVCPKASSGKVLKAMRDLINSLFHGTAPTPKAN